ncbi:Hydrogenase isoenzymes nickel incorporation protein HypB [Aquisphaera giovannonii]|uniref:Hydrogenase isoenzymes nickel incorporation protein HypB n=1 Tax=Aquisphaera giovannonii TaxID=406548 RepID=A0A5B9W3H5_9BACT|nr:hydrogenase nickel incorporation protein HypB [Aquisphaera giovannonii]QEH34799.1 Hydrogenase isoenzymes nickel incorporation protein HypB [Aquisphaera giovannonii]
MEPRILEVRKNVLHKNDELARELRARFLSEGTLTVNLVSSPGAGKTTLLRRTLAELRSRGVAVAALVGDLATDNDARRLAESGAPARQINTDGCCHLDAAMVARHLAEWSPGRIDILFIENVGNLVCTASYDLGESLRAVLLSTTEGEDKPLKYPKLFNSADVAVITKMDLAAACEFDRAAARRNILSVRPGMRILETSARTGEGLEEWLRFLEEGRAGLAGGPGTTGG